MLAGLQDKVISTGRPDLLAGQGDLCIGVPDLVPLVQNKIVPAKAQQQVSVETDTGIRRDQDTVVWNREREREREREGGREGGRERERGKGRRQGGKVREGRRRQGGKGMSL